MESFLALEQYNYSTELPSESNKIDLTLKLSPCGENSEQRRLKRSSSLVAGEMAVGNGPQCLPFVASLDRSCSLPSEAEKCLVRFGDLQTVRRAESGKRMLIERQRRVAALEAGNPSGDSKHEGGSYNIPYIARRPLAEGGVESTIKASAKQENDSMVSNKTMAKGIPPRPADTKVEIPAKRFKLGNYCSLKGDVMEILRQMPSVTTTGDGPNGKRIEGFLYKYRTGQVCIVCVCHGNFLTPAEFIMHAGGKEVANPMKHITVYTSSF